MTRVSLTGMSMLLCSQLLHAAQLTTSAFAFGLPLSTPNAAAAYRFALPLVVYQGTVREDLGDIRVFNADGDAVATFLRPDSTPTTPAELVELPLFPMPAGTRAVADDLHVTIQSQGSGVEFRSRPATDGVGVSQYILDGRQAKLPVAGMHLSWADTVVAFSGHLKIDVSDDLGRWITVMSDAPVANLRANGQAIVQNEIVLPPTLARFWRLSWVGMVPNFTLTAVAAVLVKGEPVERSFIDSAPSNAAGGDFFFNLEGHLPVDRVNLVMSEQNTVATVELSSRRRPQDPWRRIVETRFFRVHADDGEHANAPVEIGVDRDRYWRAHLTSTTGLSATPFHLRAQWIPDEVVFLARGRGPFMLAYGNAAIEEETTSGGLPTDIRIEPASTGSPQVLGGNSRLMTPSPPFPRTRLLLWGVLLAAVGTLAWMAYGLTKHKNPRI